MQYILSHYGKRVRQTLAIGGILLLSVLAQCGKKEEPPQPQAEEPKSLVEQYQEASKATAQDPGLAGSPGQLKEGQKQDK